MVAEVLVLELGQRGAKLPLPAGAGMQIDQTAQLPHGSARIRQPVLVEIHEREPDAQVRPGADRGGVAQVQQRLNGQVRCPQRHRQQRGAAKGGLDPVARVTGSLQERFHRFTVPTPRGHRLDLGELAAGPHQARVLERAGDSLDRLIHESDAAGCQSVDGPAGPGELQSFPPGPGNGKQECHCARGEQDHARGQTEQRERVLGRVSRPTPYPGHSAFGGQGDNLGRVRVGGQVDRTVLWRVNPSCPSV